MEKDLTSDRGLNAHQWLVWGQRARAIAQSGLTYTQDHYEIDRYKELQKLADEILAEYTRHPVDQVFNFYAEEQGYATPKIDVRGAVFFNNEILLVREKVDDRWSLPGGWADVGLTASENVVKEVVEESGFEVTPVKLLGVFDRSRHGHPPGPFYLYKIIIQCAIVGGSPTPGTETTEVGFFDRYNLPELSTGRTTASQIKKLFEFHDNADKPAFFD